MRSVQSGHGTPNFNGMKGMHFWHGLKDNYLKMTSLSNFQSFMGDMCILSDITWMACY